MLPEYYRNYRNFKKLAESSYNLYKIHPSLTRATSVWNVLENRLVTKHRCLHYKSKVGRV